MRGGRQVNHYGKLPDSGMRITCGKFKKVLPAKVICLAVLFEADLGPVSQLVILG